jgi:hypothetical protein
MVLQLGTTGGAVKAAQQQLTQHGYGEWLGAKKDDGVFGTCTRDAVIAFQKSKGLKADGIIGEKTLAALSADPSALVHSPQPHDSHSKKTVATTTARWRLVAQQTSTHIHGQTSKDCAEGDLLLISPTGAITKFPFKSGGHGKYDSSTMLPGLNADQRSKGDNIYADYTLEYTSMQRNSKDLPPDMKANGTGSWLRLGGKYNGRSAFGIHTDGPDGATGAISDGTKGCLGLAPKEAEAFFAALGDIPAHQRPRKLEVVPPAHIMTALAALKLNSAIQLAEHASNTYPPRSSAERPTPAAPLRG